MVNLLLISRNTYTAPHFTRTKLISTPRWISLSHARLSKLYYTKEHEWIRVSNNIGTIGISNYAQEALGDVVYVEVPAVGQAVKQKDAVGAVESVKAASDIYAPVSGKVVESNEDLVQNPAMVNSSPEDQGWLCRIELSNPAELSQLLDTADYTKHCEESLSK